MTSKSTSGLRLACVLVFGMLATRCASVPPIATTIPSNEQTLIDAPTADGIRWTVKRLGESFVIDHPGRFSFDIATAETQSDGWRVVEASAARVRFASAGRPSSLTVYADGRAYCDGEFKSMNPWMSDAGSIAASHASPAEVMVSQQYGRVDRNTPGDEDNDGYNEARGSYELAAATSRIEVTIAPRTALLARPVFEIANLPAGSVLATIEGQLILNPQRLANGNVLIELPARLERAAVVSLRVE